MESMRGWLAAFAAAAIVLVAASIQWRPSTTAVEFENYSDEMTNPAEYLISDIPDRAGNDIP